MSKLLTSLKSHFDGSKQNIVKSVYGGKKEDNFSGSLRPYHGRRATNDDTISKEKLIEVVSVPVDEDFKTIERKWSFIPKQFINKAFKFDEYTITIANKNDIRLYETPEILRDKQFRREIIRFTELTYVLVEWKGIIKVVGVYQDDNAVEYYHGSPSCTNWLSPIFSEETPYLLEKFEFDCQYEYNTSITELIDGMINTTGLAEVEFIDLDLEKMEVYGFHHLSHWIIKEGAKSSSYINVDRDFFVNSCIDKGTFKPDSQFIHALEYIQFHEYCKFRKKNNKLKPLEYDFNRVQMTLKTEFDLSSLFILDGIDEIKAPKSVIKKYGYEKYCMDDKINSALAEEKRKLEEHNEFVKHHNTFTLMQHGKVIKADVDKQMIINFLNSHEPPLLNKKTFVITKDSEITKDMKYSIETEYKQSTSNLTYDELRDWITDDYAEKEVDSCYIIRRYQLMTEKYIFEVVGKQYLKDSCVCDEEYECGITVTQLYE